MTVSAEQTVSLWSCTGPQRTEGATFSTIPLFGCATAPTVGQQFSIDYRASARAVLTVGRASS
jgi:hypothetical protein